MAANTQPLYSLTPHVSNVVIGAVNTKSDGTGTIGTDLWKAFTATTNGSFLQKIRLSPTASVAATATAATVIRIFISSVSTGTTTTANTFLWQEVQAAVVTADHSTNTAAYIEVALNFPIPNGYTVLCSTHVANAANTAWVAVVVGGDY